MEPGSERDPGHGSSATSDSEQNLVVALRQGSELAFESLMSQYYPQMLRIATMYVPSRAVAEDVVQEAWLGVLKGIDRFQERSALKTWIFRILVNTAKTRARREGRSIPFSAAWDPDQDPDEPAVAPDRFLDSSHPRWAGHWAVRPQRWEESPEERLVSMETRAFIERAIAALPPAQREVITLRDIQDWSSDEVCQALNISEANQRVLLHRARSKVRNALERYFQDR